MGKCHQPGSSPVLSEMCASWRCCCGNLCVLHDVVRCVVRGASGRVFTLASMAFQRVFSVSVLTLFLQFYMLSVFYTFLLAVSSRGGSTEL